MLQGLNLVIVHVPDVAQARAYYTEKLGFTVENDVPGFVQFKQPGGASFAIVPETAEAPDRIELWSFVDDADATCAVVHARRVAIASPTTEMPLGRPLPI